MIFCFMCDDKDFSLIQNLNAVYSIVIGKISLWKKYYHLVILWKVASQSFFRVTFGLDLMYNEIIKVKTLKVWISCAITFGFSIRFKVIWFPSSDFFVI